MEKNDSEKICEEAVKSSLDENDTKNGSEKEEKEEMSSYSNENLAIKELKNLDQNVSEMSNYLICSYRLDFFLHVYTFSHYLRFIKIMEMTCISQIFMGSVSLDTSFKSCFIMLSDFNCYLSSSVLYGSFCDFNYPRLPRLSSRAPI